MRNSSLHFQGINFRILEIALKNWHLAVGFVNDLNLSEKFSKAVQICNVPVLQISSQRFNRNPVYALLNVVTYKDLLAIE